MKDILKYNGSLLFDSSFIVAPYDYEKEKSIKKLTPLNSNKIYNYAKEPFSIDYKKVEKLNIINGMGVTLGDSIIGICCIDIIKKIKPNIQINIIRPKSCDKYVNDIYHLSQFLFNEILYMPYQLDKLNSNTVNIDIGNQLYWQDFNKLEMHDFFLRNLGVDYKYIKTEKQNNFLQRIFPNHKDKKSNYAIFCPYASTKLRSIPEKFHKKIIRMLIEKTNMQVLGYSKIEIPGYRFIGNLTNTTHDFISVIAQSSYVYTVDSSALHISAGFDIPTYCLFTSIKPNLRSIYYPNCQSHYIGFKRVECLHQSDDGEILREIMGNYETLFNF